MSSSTPSLVRRVSTTLASGLVLAALYSPPAAAGNNGDVSYEDIEHAFVDDYSGGYSWTTKSVTRDGVTGNIKLAHDVRGEPNVWDLNGSFFENTSNRVGYVRKAQEWANSDYLVDEPSNAGMVATSYVLYNASASENDVLSTWIYVNGVEIKEVQEDYVSQELLEGVILSDFDDDATITFKFKYDPAFTGSKTKTCTVNVQDDPGVFARSIAIIIETGDWWTGDGAGCTIQHNQSWGGPMELHAGWDDNICINAVGNRPNDVQDVNLYHCDYVAEDWFYGSDNKIHAVWNPSRCLNVVGSNYAGAGVNINNCAYAEEVYFGDDDILHLLADPDYCYNAYQSGVAGSEHPTDYWGAADVNTWLCAEVIDGWSMTEI